MADRYKEESLRVTSDTESPTAGLSLRFDLKRGDKGEEVISRQQAGAWTPSSAKPGRLSLGWDGVYKVALPTSSVFTAVITLDWEPSPVPQPP